MRHCHQLTRAFSFFFVTSLSFFISCASLQPTQVDTPVDTPLCTPPASRQIDQGVREWNSVAMNSHPGASQTRERPTRTSFYQIALPKDEEEVIRLNRMAIVAVTLLSHVKEDFPIGQALLKPIEATSNPSPWIELPRVLPGHLIDEIPAQSQTYRWLGSWIQTAYFYLPLRFLVDEELPAAGRELVFRPQGKLHSFSSGRLIAAAPLKYSVNMTIHEDSQILPDLTTAFVVLKRELCMGTPIEVP